MNDRIIAASAVGTLWQATALIDAWSDIATAPSDVETVHIENDQW